MPQQNPLNEYIQAIKDTVARACRIRINNGTFAQTVQVSEECLVDLSPEGHVLSIELLGASAEMTGAKRPTLAIDLITATSSFNPANFSVGEDEARISVSCETIF